MYNNVYNLKTFPYLKLNMDVKDSYYTPSANTLKKIIKSKQINQITTYEELKKQFTRQLISLSTFYNYYFSLEALELIKTEGREKIFIDQDFYKWCLNDD